MNLNIEDFFTAYPFHSEDIDDEIDVYNSTNFENVIYRKKEFHNQIAPTEPKPKTRGEPLTHQKFISRFLSSRTPYDECLLFHDVGTGKTCSAIATAELSKNIGTNYKQTLILVSGDTIRRNFIREIAFKCTKGEYIPKNYEISTKGEQVARLNKKIRNSYKILTFEIFTKMLNLLTPEQIEREYSNRVIIIDEIHNIRIHPEESSSKKQKRKDLKQQQKLNIYKTFHTFLHLVKNRKILLLSATPMKDMPFEFSSVMNLILPLDQQLPEGNDFVKEYFENDKLIQQDKLKSIVRGRISYLRSMETSLQKEFVGDLLKGNLEYFNVVKHKMSDFQKQYYLNAFNKDERDEKQGLYDNSRQASLFVYPDGSYGKTGFEKYLKKTKSGHYQLIKEFKDEITNGDKATIMERLENVKKLSCSFHDTIKQILDNPNQNIFVYCKYVKGGGIILLGEILKLFEYKRFNIENQRKFLKAKSENKEEVKIDITKVEDIEKLLEEEMEENKYFAVITGETASSFETEEIIEKFNSSENKNGKLCQVILGSQLLGEGKSLFNIRQIHILTPHWNNSEIEQAIGRGVRAFSHDELPENERNIKIFRHLSVADKLINSIDFKMYKVSEDKEKLIRQLTRLSKIVSFDCLQNKPRNLLETDMDGSRSCDYEKCEYKCDGEIDEEQELITDSYNLYYSEDDIGNMLNIIKEMFRFCSHYTLEEIQQSILSKTKVEISPMIMLKTLKSIIDLSVDIPNRFGMPCYMRENNNTFFLVDDITYSNNILLSYYEKSPEIRQEKTLQDEIDERPNLISKYLQKYKVEENKEKFLKTIQTIPLDQREKMLEIAYVLHKNNKNNFISQVIMEHYKEYINTYYDVSTLLYKDFKIMRKFENNEWNDCDEKEIDMILSHKQEEVKDFDKLDYFGILKNNAKTEQKDFLIRDNTNQKITKGGKVDHRGGSTRGFVCLTHPLMKIGKIYENINIPIPEDFNLEPPKNIKKEDYYKKILNEKFSKVKESEKKLFIKYTPEYINNLSLVELTKLVYIYIKSSKKSLCEEMKQWFIENKLMKTEE